MKKIVLALTGSIAASKGIKLFHLLKQHYDVSLLVTEGAAHFINEPLPQGCLTQVFDQPFYDKTDKVKHIDAVTDASLFVAYPASLNFMAACAYGLTNSIASLCYLAADCPKIHFPAMNSLMYDSKACRRAMQVLGQYNDTIIEPAEGLLACGTTGKGRALEPEQAYAIINNFFTPSPLKDKKVLLNFGRTRAYLDGVRYLTNQSSGQMGQQLYHRLTQAQANVTVIAGDTDQSTSYAQYAPTNQAMLEAMRQHFDNAEVVIACAALNDFEVEQPIKGKINKEQEPMLTLKLKPAIDVLETLGAIKKKQLMIGFSLQNDFNTDDALKKIAKKNLDAIVINQLTAMGSSENNIIFCTKAGKQLAFKGSKQQVATFIISCIEQMV